MCKTLMKNEEKDEEKLELLQKKLREVAEVYFLREGEVLQEYNEYQRRRTLEKRAAKDVMRKHFGRAEGCD